MYQSKLRIAHDSRAFLIKNLEAFLQKNKKVYCRTLKRRVSLEKLPQALIGRKKDAKKRLQCFVVAMDILQKVSEHTEVYKKGYRCFEICGLDAAGKEIVIHLREEQNQRKDKILCFISTFYRGL